MKKYQVIKHKISKNKMLYAEPHQKCLSDVRGTYVDTPAVQSSLDCVSNVRYT